MTGIKSFSIILGIKKIKDVNIVQTPVIGYIRDNWSFSIEINQRDGSLIEKDKIIKNAYMKKVRDNWNYRNEISLKLQL